MQNVYDKVASAGVDVHYRFSTVALADRTGRGVRRERLDHPDREALRARVARWPTGMPVVLEASFGWGWLSDLLEEVGLDVRLSNCFKVEKMRQARGMVKTNDKDAALLARLPWEPTNGWEVWRAPPDVRDRREWMRHRMDLVAVQTQVKCRIHALFHRHGIFHDFSDLFGAGGRRFLAALCARQAPQSGYLPAGALEALRSEVGLLLHLRQELAEIARGLRASLERSDVTGWLHSVPGFGVILAHVVTAEIGDLDRFRSAKALASYSLLAPRSRDTGAAPAGGRAPLGRHLGRRGNRTLKWAFIEAAHGAVRSGGPWRALFDRVTDGGRKDCGRGYIKVARALVDVVYALWRDGRRYEARRPPRREVRMDARHWYSVDRTRPGTGRPVRPMVAAEP
mgnify:CR=1 FL=1